MRITISRGSTRAVVGTLGAHVVGATLNGTPTIKPSRDGSQTHGGVAVLMPYAGRVRRGRYRFESRTFLLPVGKEGHAIHGFAKDAVWKVERKASDSIVLVSRLEGEGYPGALAARIAYSVGRTSLSTDCSVTNVGATDCPLVVGFHPYFLARKWRIKAGRGTYRYRLRDRYFPTGERARYSFDGVGPDTELDDCFRVGGTVRLQTEGREIVIRRRAMPYLVIYDGKYADGKSVAIEPYTGLPNAYNNGIGLRILKPGRRLRCGYDVELRKSTESR